RRSRARDGQEPRQLVAELAAVHVVGVAAEARVPPPDVRGAGPDRTASPEAGEPVIGEARAGERRGEGFPREGRRATGGRGGAGRGNCPEVLLRGERA